MNTDVFDYFVPKKLIAQQPADRRDASRLLVVNRKSGCIAHRTFRDLPEYLHHGDCLFRNNASVIPARLYATRPTGGQVECLLLRSVTAGQRETVSGTCQWWCLLRPGKKLPVGAIFGISGSFNATVLEKTEEGLACVSFDVSDAEILAVANRIGEMPLPPYIERNLTAGGEEPGKNAVAQRSLDCERYQTVYANRARQVAVAAPTAGLHFTPELLNRLHALGVSNADLTLHVGLGTFRPITAEKIEDHAIHREIYELNAATQRALFFNPGRRVAVGTTSVRTIEDFLVKNPGPSTVDCVSEAEIFIYPPFNFRGVDALITNFHQPRSTLLCLVASFLTPGSAEGIPWLREIYAEAIAREYRFFSYGDAMLIV